MAWYLTQPIGLAGTAVKHKAGERVGVVRATNLPRYSWFIVPLYGPASGYGIAVTDKEFHEFVEWREGDATDGQQV